MNDQTPATPQVNATPPPLPYKDRSTGLVVFGICTILLGCLAALCVPLVLFGQAASARAAGTPTPISTLLPVVSIYGVLAVVLVWLGIGSLVARRWARALLLILSWSWLIIGVITSACMVFVLPKILAKGAGGQPMPPAAVGIVAAVTAVILGVFFLLLPGVWAFFYQSRHVKATCEARDPVVRWTDACPLPVLGACLWMAFSALMLLLMPLTGHAVIPVFGTFLAGVPGMFCCMVLAVVWGYAAWSLYQLQQRGWWLIVAALCVLPVSALLTYARHDVIEMYRVAGYPETQVEQIKRTGLFTGNALSWIMGLSVLPWVGYLLFLKKFLRR